MPRSRDQLKKLRSEEKITKSKENRENILKSLLEFDELTKEEIAGKIGVNRDYGPWVPLKTPMNELEKESLIEVCSTDDCERRRLKREKAQLRKDPNIKSKFNQPKERGTKPKVWIIKRDVSSIHTIFNTYHALQDLLWQKEWVRTLIVEKQLDTRGIERNDIRELEKMLKLSRHFFELCVNYPDLYRLTIEWEYYLNPILEMPPKEYAERLAAHHNVEVIGITSYRHFFALCYFMDIFNGIKIDGAQRLAENYWSKRNRESKSMHRDNILSAMEKVMIPTITMFFDYIGGGKFESPDPKSSEYMKSLQNLIHDYQTTDKRIKDAKKDPDPWDRITQYEGDQRRTFIQILCLLYEQGVIRKNVIP
jgi:hypothetical protein